MDVNGLIRRVESLLSVLELVVRDIADVRDELKFLVEKCMSALEVTVENVKEMFPEKLRAHLSFSEADDYIIVNMQRRLQPEAFKSIVGIAIGKLAGEYVSLGGGSGYFRIPKKHA